MIFCFRTFFEAGAASFAKNTGYTRRTCKQRVSMFSEVLCRSHSTREPTVDELEAKGALYQFHLRERRTVRALV